MFTKQKSCAERGARFGGAARGRKCSKDWHHQKSENRKMNFVEKWISFCTFLQLFDTINSVELTFELPDNSKECFYQEIGKNKTAILEYQVGKDLKSEKLLTVTRKLLWLQVITGGQYDVDVELLSPTKEIVYRQIKSQFDSHQFTAPVRFFPIIPDHPANYAN